MEKFNKYEMLLVITVIRKILELNVTFPKAYFIIEMIVYCLLFAMIIFDIKKSKFIVAKKDILLIFIMLVGEIFGLLYTYFLSNTINKFFYRIIEFIECFYLMYLCIPKIRNFRKNDFNRILRLVILIAFISAVYAMVFQFNGSLFKVSSNNNFRMDNLYQSFLGHRNQFGITLVAGIYACMYFIINNISKRKMTLLLLLFLFNLIFTYSRASYVAFLCFAFWYFIMGKKNLKVKLVTIFAIIFIGISGYGLYTSNYNIHNFVDKYMIRSDSGMTGREVLWDKAMSYLDLPTCIFGRSWGISRILLQDDNVGHGVGFHNMYLTDLITGGVILLLFFLIILSNIWRMINSSSVNISMKNYFHACMFAFLVYSFFEVTDFFKIGIQQMFQTLFCITLPMLYLKINKGDYDEK